MCEALPDPPLVHQVRTRHQILNSCTPGHDKSSDTHFLYTRSRMVIKYSLLVHQVTTGHQIFTSCTPGHDRLSNTRFSHTRSRQVMKYSFLDHCARIRYTKKKIKTCYSEKKKWVQWVSVAAASLQVFPWSVLPHLWRGHDAQVWRVLCLVFTSSSIIFRQLAMFISVLNLCFFFPSWY